MYVFSQKDTDKCRVLVEVLSDDEGEISKHLLVTWRKKKNVTGTLHHKWSIRNAEKAEGKLMQTS